MDGAGPRFSSTMQQVYITFKEGLLTVRRVVERQALSLPVRVLLLTEIGACKWMAALGGDEYLG
jgi:hypothetical protein